MNLAEDPEALSLIIGNAMALLHVARTRPATDEDRDALEAGQAADVKFEYEDPEAQDYMARNLADPAGTAMILAIWRAGLLNDADRAMAAAKSLKAGTDPTFFALYQVGRLRTELEFSPNPDFAGIRLGESRRGDGTA